MTMSVVQIIYNQIYDQVMDLSIMQSRLALGLYCYTVVARQHEYRNTLNVSASSEASLSKHKRNKNKTQQHSRFTQNIFYISTIV